MADTSHGTGGLTFDKRKRALPGELNIFFAHKVWFNLKASLINKENQS